MASNGMFDVAGAAFSAASGKTDDPATLLAGLACATITAMAAVGSSRQMVKETITAMIDRHYDAVSAQLHGAAP